MALNFYVLLSIAYAGDSTTAAAARETDPVAAYGIPFAQLGAWGVVVYLLLRRLDSLDRSLRALVARIDYAAGAGGASRDDPTPAHGIRVRAPNGGNDTA